MVLTRPILIGTSGYSYPGAPPKGWYGAFYPDKKAKGFDELKYYSEIFNTVEINSTFYRPASQTITQNWATKTPSDFSFAVKLWQKFTHPKKIGRKNVEEEWESITQEDFDKVRAGLEPLADAGKLGALLLQYPAGFHCTPENVESVERTLRAFADYAKVVELRHKSWSENSAETNTLLKENRASEVIIDEPKFSTSIRQELNLSATYFTSERMAEMQRHGGNMRSRGNGTTISTRELRSKKSQSALKPPRVNQELRKHSRYSTIMRTPTQRRTRSCFLRNWESGLKRCRAR
jgi:uncharacterized protein YecE (DUF72 family)